MAISTERTAAQPTPLPSEPYPIDPRTATRHLCAGAYLDEAFRDESLREVYYQPKRVVAPSFGFDAIPVLAHAIRSRNAAAIRDGAILLTVVVALCTAGVSLILVLAAMASMQAVVNTYRFGRDVVRQLRAGEPMQIRTLISRVLILMIGYFFAPLAVLAGLLVTGKLTSTSGGTDEFGNTTSTSDITISKAGIILVFVLLFGLSIGFTLWRQAQLARMAPGAPVTQPVHSRRLEEVSRQQLGNTTVYSGFHSYVGSGSVLDTWGFAVRLVKAEDPTARQLNGVLGDEGTERQREFEQLPFTGQELVDFVRERLSSLLPERAAEEQIAGLTVQDRVCLAGTEVSQLLPWTSPEVMAAVVRHPTTPARHYLACQVFAWGGQLIPTVYVHVAVQGRSLYLELTTTVLPPCKEEYRIIDTVEGHGAIAWWRALRAGFVDAPRTIWRSPVNLTRTLINLVAGQANVAAGSTVQRGYDYGARVGVRELGSEPGVRFLTQAQDVAKYKKLIERRVIASVLDYLDDHDVDTSEFRARAASVLNISGGIFARGGTVSFAGPTSGGDMTNAGGQ